jgi:phosphomannomutase
MAGQGNIPDNARYMFRAYDIRGVYGKGMTEETIKGIGRAFSLLVEGDTVVVARDARLSGESLSRAFMQGAASAGKNVIDIGMLPIGVGMFHAWKKKMTFAYITASHLPKEWNGLKFFKSSGIGFMEDELERIRDSFFKNEPSEVSEREKGRITAMDNKEVITAYTNHLFERMSPEKKLRIAIDPGNGAAGVVVRDLFTRGGFDVNIINEEPDGNFPNRSPDPAADPLEDLKKHVTGTDFGMAFDGDGDRLVIMDDTGIKLSPEQISFIILPEILRKERGPIIANVEVTRTIDRIAEQFNRNVHRVRVGHNYLVKASYEEKACFGMERSGHFTAPWIFPFDDVMAISYYFACIQSKKGRRLSEAIKAVPAMPFKRINFDVPDDKKFGVIDTIREELRKRYPNLNTMDGVRVDKDNGWALVRVSNTGPEIRLTIEANTRSDLKSIEEEFRGLIERYINT